MRKLGMSLIIVMIGFTVLAQDKTDFTDDELSSYATVMKWASAEKESMKSTYNGWIRGNEAISAKKFSEMKSADKKGNLTEVASTEEEMTAFNEIQGQYKQMAGEFKEVYTLKIKEDIGISLYNSLNKALKSDTELKSRYETVLTSLEETTAEITEEKN